MRTRTALFLGAIAAFVASGCVQQYSADERPCPCADGYFCCAATGTCLEEGRDCPCADEDCPEGGYCDAQGECHPAADADLVVGRYGHASVLLEDGRVLTTGGIRRLATGHEEILATAEIFDPVSGRMRLLQDDHGLPLTMHATSGRAFHTMTRLRDGKVLIAGGAAPLPGSDGALTALRSAELFDPETDSFITPMDMGDGRARHSATALAVGPVLLAGGVVYDGAGSIDHWLDSAVVYDANDQSWTPVSGAMAGGRAQHRAVMLDPATTQGKVLILGGRGRAGVSTSIDIYNPNGNQFYQGVDLHLARPGVDACAVRLPSGRVLVAGGSAVADDPATDPLEHEALDGLALYDPFGGAYGTLQESASAMSTARSQHTCTLLDDGWVLVAGGLDEDGLATAALDLISEDDWTLTVEQHPEPLASGRFGHTAVKLHSGRVLILGGLASTAPDGEVIGRTEMR